MFQDTGEVTQLALSTQSPPLTRRLQLLSGNKSQKRLFSMNLRHFQLAPIQLL